MAPVRAAHVVTAAVTFVAVGVQLVNNLVEAPGRGFVPDPSAYGSALERAATFFSFFTIQSNILIAFSSAALAIQPDRRERWVAWVRLSALVGITVTFLVNLLVLRPVTADLYDGVWVVTDFLLHYLTPGLAIVSWLAFGPHPRFDGRLVVLFLAWPVAWLAYTFARGAAIGWYPYPFLDVQLHGYDGALAGVAGVAVVGVAVAACFVWLDRRLGGTGKAQA